MFKPIQDYILLSQEERQSHLNLSEDCICIGGMSGEYRALLAHYLKTTIPTKLKVYLCHACHNGKCSNPRHLYWGTPKENFEDLRESGKWKPAHQATKDKYGEEAYRKLLKEAASKGGKAPRTCSSVGRTADS